MAIGEIKSLFAIMAPTDDPRLEHAITTRFPHDSMKVCPGQWLVATSGTSKDLSDLLGISTGAVGGAIVVSFSGYYGRASTNIWEWIASRMGAAKNA